MRLKDLILPPVLIFALMISGCKDDNLYQGPGNNKDKEDYFDFSTTKSVDLKVNYGLNNYPIVFEVYAENPFQEAADGSQVKKDIEPVYRAITDAKGQFYGKVTIPTYLDKVFIHSDYLGVLQNSETEVTTTGIAFDVPAFYAKKKAQARATNGNNFTYPDGYKILGDWDAHGIPSYLLPEISDSENVVKRLKKVIIPGYQSGFERLQVRMPELFNNNNSDLDIVKNTRINFIYYGSSASYKNAIGYYTYKTGTIPSLEDIQRTIVFPHAAGSYKLENVSTPVLKVGNQAELKYWNAENSTFEDEFPAGITIGWFIVNNGFSNGNITEKVTNYSSNAFKKNYQPSVVLKEDNKKYAICFEDQYFDSSRDDDYDDLIFFVTTSVEDAIDDNNKVGIPEEGGDPTETSITYKGSLAFEDLWPEKGDYDMNDIVLDYKSVVYKNKDNKVTKIIDSYISRTLPGAADKINGFGYQFDGISNDAATSVSVVSTTALGGNFPISGFMPDANSFEQGQSHPTIILYDNSKDVITNGATFTVTTTFNLVDESAVVPPYNPFIIIDSDKTRNKELHLANYKPTDKADYSYFQTKDDESNPDKAIYYVSGNNYPFALHLPGVSFDFPGEKVHIEKTYSKFGSWVSSFGTNDTDWYLHKN